MLMRIVSGFASGCLVALLLGFVPPAAAQWPQWGGPHRNFTADAAALADAWPEDGPPVLWRRALGDGYASIIVDEGLLYTMYRVEHDEFTIALDARTGRTVWEHKNHSPYTPAMAEYGAGPHASPLAVGQRVFSVGSNMHLHAFDKRTGKVLWRHDLVAEFGGEVPHYGYASSPVAYDGTIILPGPCSRTQEAPLMAFDQATGKVRWRNEPHAETQSEQFEYSSPLLVTLDGEQQVVFLGSERISGFKPNDGTLLWSRPHANRTGVNCAMPVWDRRGLLFCSAAYDSGARLLRLRHTSPTTAAEELWYTRKMRIHHGNALILGDSVYGSSGDFGPAFFMALDLETGKRLWVHRGLRKATFVYADGKFILLDEDGRLVLAKANAGGLEVLSACKLTERYSWTAPSLADDTLYVRDRKHILALDVSRHD
jgi:outer membrane protein assembly factor BamB